MTPAQQKQVDLMGEYLETHSYNESDDWRTTKATASDPIDDTTSGKSLPVVKINPC